MGSCGRILALAAVAAVSLRAGGLAAQQGQVRGVATNLPPEEFVDRAEPLEVRFEGALEPGERLAVFVGSRDLTGVFLPIEGGLRLAPSAPPLPAGESELVVYRIGADEIWEEIHREPIRVRNALGLDRSRLAPQVQLGLEGALAEGHDPEEAGPERATYQDLTGQLDLETELARGTYAGLGHATVIGVSHQEDALRFGELGPDAPRVDLSNYLVQLRAGQAGLSVGHVMLGRQRHLIDGFASRGARFELGTGSRVDFAAGVANGSSIVGWSNPLGLADSNHRIVSGTLGVDALNRPGGLRVEVSGMDGSRRPEAGFNQGVLNDAEESRGFAFRVEASDPSERLRVEGGFARSTFDNPEDPLLSQDVSLVPVRRTSRNARFAEGSLDILRDVALGSRSASLTVGYRHERVDPLFRTLGALPQSDYLANAWTVRAMVAGVGVQAVHERSEDNLDDLPSVLKTLNRRTGLGVTVPLTVVLGRPDAWLPTLAYDFSRTRQFGAELPENGDFSDSHVPDQVSRIQSLSADWELGRFRLSYHLDHSLQDNRQVGREDADFSTLVNGLAFGIRPLASLGVDLSLDLERAKNDELDELERTRRYAAAVDWAPFDRSTLSFSVAFTRSKDAAGLRRREDALVDAQWASFIPGLGGREGRYYLRFSLTTADALDRTFDLDEHRSQWTINSGLSLNLFSR